MPRIPSTPIYVTRSIPPVIELFAISAMVVFMITLLVPVVQSNGRASVVQSFAHKTKVNPSVVNRGMTAVRNARL